MLRKEEYEIIAKDALVKELVFKRGIKPGEHINFMDYNYPIVIKGSIGEGAVVNALFNLTVEGNIEANSAVTAKQGFVIAKMIGEKANIQAGTRIETSSVGKSVNLEARDSITTQDVGSHCKIVSTDGSVRTGNVMEFTEITALHAVYCKNVGEHDRLTSRKSEIFLKDVCAYAEINAFSNISFKSVNELTHLKSEHGELLIQVDAEGRAFKPYNRVATTDSSNPSFFNGHPLTENLSVNVKNANLDTLSIDIGSINFKDLLTSTLFTNKKIHSENSLTVNNENDKLTYNSDNQRGYLEPKSMRG
ncbi:MAG: hypothetical protein H0W64_11645 [Gammaproteobacteria bacterium]|nr:hypothetical protein [Gammaproteobacteria bacterium]